MLSCIVITCCFILCLLHTNHDTSAFSPHLFPAQKSFYEKKYQSIIIKRKYQSKYLILCDLQK